MFKDIFLFELKYRLSRPATYLYFGLLFLLAFAAASWDQLSIGISSEQIKANAPYAITITSIALSLIGVLIVSAVMGVPVFRDFDHNTAEIYFSKPITKKGYLLGRFFGSLVIILVILFGINIGLMLGHSMPWLETDSLKTFNLLAYLQPYLLFQVPLVLSTGTIFFALGSLSKRLLVIYTQGIVFFVLFAIAVQLGSNLESQFLAALIDPFGFNSVEILTKYWTINDKNTLMVPLQGVLLYNRLIWLGVSILIFFIFYRLFTFSNEPLIKIKKKKTSLSAQNETKELGRSISQLALPRIAPDFSFKTRLAQFLEILRINFSYVIRSVPFIAIVLMGIMNVIINASAAQNMYGTPVQPVTYIMAGFIGDVFTLYFIILITFYAGELYWKERDYRFNEIMDVAPFPTWLHVAGKYLSLILVIIVLFGVLILSGIGIQLWEGFYNIELGTYLTVLFTDKFPQLVELIFLAFFIHVVSNHKFIGHAIVILLYLIIFIGLPELDLHHNLFQYSSSPGLVYSDMNGIGPFGQGIFWFHTYWMAFAFILGGLGYLIWQRGTLAAFPERLQEAKKRFNKPVIAYFSSFLLVFLATGTYIYYNTNILNNYQTSDELEKLGARYEKKYAQYDSMAQPKITSVDVNLALYPEKRDFHLKGDYMLKNKTSQSIDTIFVELRRTDNMKVNEISFSEANEEVYHDSAYPFSLYRLQKPLKPGDSLSMAFDILYPTKGFENGRPNMSIVENGTFINSRYLPSIGYAEENEVDGREDRNEHGLPKKPRAAKLEDMSMWYESFITDDADYVDFKATLSTIKGQKAVAPGYLQKKWEKDGRVYYQYEMDEKIPHFFSFLSADYQLDKERWINSKGQEIPVEIYYHKGHDYNLDKMQKGAQQALDYYSMHFGPYPHEQLRIFEFPRYRGFAQSFPNTVPFSEAIGFIAKVGENDIDYPFFVTAHEVAHQWWGHQILPANVQGAQFLSESLSEYSALMVMKHEYGKEKMRRFLEYELDQYLSGRSFESRKEMPLMRVEGQGYIAYRKGSVVLYALQDYIGEDSVNKALRRFLRKNKFSSNPYPISKELVKEFEKVTPDSFQYVIKDMFKTITLYDNRIEKATYEKLDDGRYKVALTVKSDKYRADSLGRQKSIPVNDWMDIGIFGKSEDGKLTNPIYLQKHKIDDPKESIKVIVDKKPVRSGLDPYLKLIDRNRDDNVMAVKKE